jgi:hypothetical protein
MKVVSPICDMQQNPSPSPSQSISFHPILEMEDRMMRDGQELA